MKATFSDKKKKREEKKNLRNSSPGDPYEKNLSLEKEK